jgi:transposase
VRRDTGESYQDFLTKLAQASGIETPTRADLARIDRKRKKKGSNDDWTHPHDTDAKITKMKDGRTHLAHKAEHAVDLETGVIVAVTVQDADDGDTETSIETLIEAAEQVETVRPDGAGIEEMVGDKGYHSNQSLVDLEAVGVRRYISEPYRGRRNWKKNPEARNAVYRNRRRIRGARGVRLLRLRGERLERPFAHLYETGGMRRVYLRGHTNIRKRLLIHTAGFNLGLLMRHLIGVGTPRGLQGRLLSVVATLCSLLRSLWSVVTGQGRSTDLGFTNQATFAPGLRPHLRRGARSGFHHGLLAFPSVHRSPSQNPPSQNRWYQREQASSHTVE